MNHTPKAFVIMPFEPEFSPIFEDLIRPALEDAGYNVSRADSFLDQQNILRDIVRGIGSADLIIADLTTMNPNVLYELGLCHGLRIPTILLTQSMDEVPFDLRSYRILVYSTRFDQVHKLKEALVEIAKKHRNRELAFGSPIIDFLPGGPSAPERPPSSKPPSDPANQEVPQQAAEPEEEKGFLDHFIGMLEAGKETTRIMEEIGGATRQVGERINTHAEKIQELAQNPGPGTPSQVHRISIAAAVDMTTYAECIEGNLPSLEKSMGDMTESFFEYFKWLDPKINQNKENLLKLRKTVVGLQETVRRALGGTQTFRTTVASLKGISREINRGSRRLAQGLDGVISVMETCEAFCVRILLLIDERLSEN